MWECFLGLLHAICMWFTYDLISLHSSYLFLCVRAVLLCCHANASIVTPIEHIPLSKKRLVYISPFPSSRIGSDHVGSA